MHLGSFRIYRRKRNFLAVELTTSPAYPGMKPHKFRCLYVPETIEWE
jgi:hypothetical protein